MNTRCVIGIGCDDHGDQIAGLLVARMVRRIAPQEFHIVESVGSPTALITAWTGARSAVIIEAMPGDEPGVVRRCQPHPLRQGQGCSSTRVSPRLREALALGPLPDQVTVITIGGRCFAQDAPVTPSVARAAAKVADTILAERPVRVLTPA